MSKVKHYVDNNKQKAIRRLRRQESNNKKRSRIKNVRDNVYSYPAGYYIKDVVWTSDINYVDVPEKVIDVKEFYYETYSFTDVDGNEVQLNTLKSRVIDQKIIPAHKKKVKTNYRAVPVESRLKRINVTKKPYKKISNKKVRQYKNDLNSSDYKKVFDIAWSVC